MTKFGTIRYCPDCGSELKEASYEECDIWHGVCPIHRFVVIEFSIHDDIEVKRE